MGYRLMGAEQGAALVQARLGRPAQDALEAAVVLEAWGGLRPSTALRLGREIKAAELGSGRDRRLHDDDPRPRWRLSEQIALVVALVTLLAWSGPLIAAYGARAFEVTWMTAVPLTLAAQHAIRRRYLAGVDGVGRLRDDGPALLLLTAVLPGLLAAVVGVGGALAGLFVVVWVSAAIVGQRGWGLLHALLLVAVVLGLWSDLPTPAVLLLAGIGALGLTIAAVLTSPVSTRLPGAWRPVLLTSGTGLGLGIMLIVDGPIRWDAAGPLPALLLLPSVLAGLWGGVHLDRLWDVLAWALRDTTLRAPAQTRAHREATGVVVAATLRLTALAVLLSVVVASTPWASRAPAPLVWGLLGGFAVVALAMLAVTLTESFGRPAWAFGAVWAGVAAELAVMTALTDPPPAGGLIVGGLVTIGAVVPSVTALLRQPARTLATVVNVQ